jgi:hypothetical protein
MVVARATWYRAEAARHARRVESDLERWFSETLVLRAGTTLDVGARSTVSESTATSSSAARDLRVLTAVFEWVSSSGVFEWVSSSGCLRVGVFEWAVAHDPNGRYA